MIFQIKNDGTFLMTLAKLCQIIAQFAAREKKKTKKNFLERKRIIYEYNSTTHTHAHKLAGDLLDDIN